MKCDYCSVSGPFSLVSRGRIAPLDHNHRKGGRETVRGSSGRATVTRLQIIHSIPHRLLTNVCASIFITLLLRPGLDRARATLESCNCSVDGPSVDGPGKIVHHEDGRLPS